MNIIIFVHFRLLSQQKLLKLTPNFQEPFILQLKQVRHLEVNSKFVQLSQTKSNSTLLVEYFCGNQMVYA
jgi:hypothetical protein